MLTFLIFVCAILAILFILPYLLISANPFPNPSGKWHVGTTDLIWDKPDLSGIIAKVWYPTDVKYNTGSPYIDRIDLILSTLTAGKIRYTSLFLSCISIEFRLQFLVMLFWAIFQMVFR